ncbi:hypothetical protein [Nocardioides convexus]|uniref:hypothetical protein n=1 Tax=Nocardioides convexus TaxID=2712224 RepID=UPI00241853B1|nr:hypothetical protein [Nocardioides convexus]
MRDLLEWAGLGWNGPPDEGLVFALSGSLDLAYVRDTESHAPDLPRGPRRRPGDRPADAPGGSGLGARHRRPERGMGLGA